MHLTAFPPDVPAEGLRSDRHDWPGLHFKLWRSEHGWRSALYAGSEPPAGAVTRLADLVRSGLPDLVRRHGNRTDISCIDAIADLDGIRLESFGITGNTTPHLFRLAEAEPLLVDEMLACSAP